VCLTVRAVPCLHFALEVHRVGYELCYLQRWALYGAHSSSAGTVRAVWPICTMRPVTDRIGRDILPVATTRRMALQGTPLHGTARHGTACLADRNFLVFIGRHNHRLRILTHTPIRTPIVRHCGSK
jgi:hypothetical protein